MIHHGRPHHDAARQSCKYVCICMYRNQVSLSLLLPLSTFSGKGFLLFLVPILLSSFLLRRSGGK